MTTRSTASHELPRRSSPSIPEGDDSAWTAKLQRARDALLGAVRGAWTPNQSVDAPPAPAPIPVSEVATADPPSPEPKLLRQDDRTTSIYQRPALECAVAPLLLRGELPSEEVSVTCRLPSADLEALLLQLQYDAASQATAIPESQDRAAPAVEVEVSSITFEELEAFRRSLVDRSTEADEEACSPNAATMPPPALPARPSPGSTLRRVLRSSTMLTLHRGKAIAARCALRLRELGRALMMSIVKFRLRYHKAKQPGLIASESRAESTDEASAVEVRSEATKL